MATRRMISVNIINSARFIMMPQSTQALYFHLVARGDDDGVVEAFPVMRLVGATEDELKILVAKKFISILNDDLVAHITDWLEHNKIRSDRKVDSIYKNLLVEVLPDVALIEAKQRKDRPKDNQVSTVGRPKDNQVSTNGQPRDGVGEVRLVEVSIIKDTLQEEVPMSSPIDSEKEERFERFWTFYNYKKEKKKAKANFMKLSQRQIDEVSKVLGEYIANTHTDGTFPSRMYPARYLNPKSELWNDEIVATTKSKAETTAPMAKQKTGVFAR